MSGPHSDEQSLWQLISVRLGAVSAAVGIVVALVGLPQQVTDALRGDDGQLSKKERLEIAAAAPRLDVSYAILASDVLYQVEKAKERGAPKAVNTLASFPEYENEISGAFRGEAPSTRGCRLRGYSLFSIAYLVIQNRGGRAARTIDVAFDRLMLARRVIVREAAVGGDDYVEKIREAAKRPIRGEFHVPWTLEPGDGIRIPLFISANDPEADPRRWCVVSRVAYQPRSLLFVDAVLGEPATISVRRMRDPVRLWAGAWARG